MKRVALVSILVLLTCVSLVTQAQRRSSADWRTAELRNVLSRVQGAAGAWKIPASSTEQGAIAKLGAFEFPLELLDPTGRVVGEAYRIVEGDQYRGFVLLRDPRGAAFRSQFFPKEWPLNQLAQGLKAMEADDPLKEPNVKLVLDENRLMLMVNVGKTEREIEFMRFDPKESNR